MVKNSLRKNIVIYICAAVLVFICVFPFIVELSVSLKPVSEWQEPNLIPKKPTLENYKELLGITPAVNPEDLPESVKRALERPSLNREQRNAILEKYINTSDIFPFPKYMKNSFLFSAGSAFFSLILAILGAYSVSRLNFPGRKIIQRSILLIYMVNGILLMIPLFQIFTKLGLNQTNIGRASALTAIYVLQTLPVAIFMLGNYFRTIPYSLEEAATIDGCSRMKTILVIIVPLALPMIITVFVYCFIIGWNEYLFASIFLEKNRDMFTLPIALNTLFSSMHFIWGRIMAASIMTLLPVVVVYAFMMKFFSSGLTDGGVKE